MASNLMSLSRFPNTIFGSNFDSGLNMLLLRTVCKSPGQSQKGKKRPPKHIRIVCIPGQKVEERALIGKQKGLKYHPGFNVGLDPKDRSLYSLCAGTVFYSIEKFNPNRKNSFVQQFHDKQLGPIYKKYIHVVRDRDPKEFKLIDIV